MIDPLPCWTLRDVHEILFLQTRLCSYFCEAKKFYLPSRSCSKHAFNPFRCLICSSMKLASMRVSCLAEQSDTAPEFASWRSSVKLLQVVSSELADLNFHSFLQTFIFLQCSLALGPSCNFSSFEQLIAADCRDRVWVFIALVSNSFYIMGYIYNKLISRGPNQ